MECGICFRHDEYSFESEWGPWVECIQNRAKDMFAEPLSGYRTGVAIEQDGQLPSCLRMLLHFRLRYLDVLSSDVRNH